MSDLYYFCAGADMKDLPGGSVENLFLSAVTAGKTESQIKRAIELMKNSKPSRVILDSGGYSLGKAEENAHKNHLNLPLDHFIKDLKLSPENVVNVAMRLRVKEFVGLDFPIQEVPLPDREAEFRRKLEYNLPWAIETAELREKHCPQIGLLLPVQCFTLPQLNEFLNDIRLLSFDGLAMPKHEKTLTEVALFLHRFWQAGIHRVHLLGKSDILGMALSGYMARHFFEEFSVDSTTWHYKCGTPSYLNPHNLTKIEINKYTEIDPMTRMDCPGPYCRNRSFSYVKHQPRPDRRQFLLCHNFFVISRMCKTVYEHSRSLDDLEAFLEKYATEKQRHPDKNTDEVRDLITALSVIEAMKNDDTRDIEKLLIH